MVRSLATGIREARGLSDGPIAAGAGQIVLIVEDEILAAMAIRDELKDAGYRVLDLTGRPEEVAAIVRDDLPDIALVNIRLHGRDDGLAVAETLTDHGVPVVFISGQGDRARSARSRAIASFPKPYSAADMVRAVTYLLGWLEGLETPAAPQGLEVFGAVGSD